MINTTKKKIAIFGHYGNKNLGDESIIQAMLEQMQQRLPEAEFVGMSINPIDTAFRHQLESFPIRRKENVVARSVSPEQAAATLKAQQEQAAQNSNQTSADTINEKSLKEMIKRLPLVGSGLRIAAALVRQCFEIKAEIVFLLAARSYMKTVDLIVVTGSNQFLDNFGGAWGFPYTLLKWTLLAKNCGAKVAFASVGAGPLKRPLSFRMLAVALRKADFVSYRDEGSRELVESKISGINGKLYPDIAHSLDYQTTTKPKNDCLTISINPMPVYDSRYWPIADEQKYSNYVNKVESLCVEVLEAGHELILFSTQSRDAGVIFDILEILKQKPCYSQNQNRIKVVNNDSVAGLMETIASSHVIVATRFHATVLPLQLGIPVLGICYYRKAAELLDDVGLENYHVNIDEFSAQELLTKFQSLSAQHRTLAATVASHHQQYAADLDEQYNAIASLLTT